MKFTIKRQLLGLVLCVTWAAPLHAADTRSIHAVDKPLALHLGRFIAALQPRTAAVVHTFLFSPRMISIEQLKLKLDAAESEQLKRIIDMAKSRDKTGVVITDKLETRILESPDLFERLTVLKQAWEDRPGQSNLQMAVKRAKVALMQRGEELQKEFSIKRYGSVTAPINGIAYDSGWQKVARLLDLRSKMIVTKIETFPIRLPYDQSIADARSLITHKATVLVRIETNTGVVGWGEAAAFGNVAGAVAELIHTNLAPIVIGQKVAPADVRTVLINRTAHFGQGGAVTMAISGLEIALWDALAREAGLPLCELLGGVPQQIKLYATTGYYAGGESSKEQDLALLKRDLTLFNQAAQKLRGIKIKIGRYGVGDDVARVRAAREAIGEKPILIADANNASSFKQALEFAYRAAPYNLLFLEEPISYGRADLSAVLRRLSDVPIGGYELGAPLGYAGFLPYIQHRSVDFLQPDCIWTGGLLESLAIAWAAKLAHIPTVPHNFASAISTAANYHALSVVGGDILETDGTNSPFNQFQFVEDAREISPNGDLVIKRAPGLGIVPDVDQIRKLSRSVFPTALIVKH